MLDKPVTIWEIYENRRSRERMAEEIARGEDERFASRVLAERRRRRWQRLRTAVARRSRD